MFYVPKPTTYNLILQLNDDCLLHLQTFLSAKDWSSFRETHPRLRQLQARSYHVDKSRMERLPLRYNRNFYAETGSVVSSLSVVGTVMRDFSEMIPYFTKLKELSLEFPRYNNNNFFQHIPSGLQKLVLSGGMNKYRSDLTSLFRRLNPTLKTLHLRFIGLVIGITELTEIEDFECTDNTKLTLMYVKFLSGNKESLQHLKVSLNDSKLVHLFWSIVGQMQRLESLTVDDSPLSWEILSLENDNTTEYLPALEELDIFGASPQSFAKFLGMIRSTKLRSISFNASSCSENPELIERLLNHTGLQKLLLGFVDDHMAIRLIKGLEKLEVVDIHGLSRMTTINQIRAHMRLVGRKICLNSRIVE